MTTQAQPMTAEELAQLPDDGWRYELVQGVLHKMAPAGGEHGVIAVRLTWRLAQYVEMNGLGVVCAAETGFRLASTPDTVRAADVSFIRQERVSALGIGPGFWIGAPDLAVEVVSPGDRADEVKGKVHDWLDAGTHMVIIIEPRKQSVTVYRSPTEITNLTINDELTGGDVVPGWAMPVSALFAPLGAS
jgi:Uma2 family endonuclease